MRNVASNGQFLTRHRLTDVKVHTSAICSSAFTTTTSAEVVSQDCKPSTVAVYPIPTYDIATEETLQKKLMRRLQKTYPTASEELVQNTVDQSFESYGISHSYYNEEEGGYVTGRCCNDSCQDYVCQILKTLPQAKSPYEGHTKPLIDPDTKEVIQKKYAVCEQPLEPFEAMKQTVEGNRQRKVLRDAKKAAQTEKELAEEEFWEQAATNSRGSPQVS